MVIASPCIPVSIIVVIETVSFVRSFVHCHHLLHLKNLPGVMVFSRPIQSPSPPSYILITVLYYRDPAYCCCFCGGDSFVFLLLFYCYCPGSLSCFLVPGYSRTEFPLLLCDLVLLLSVGRSSLLHSAGLLLRSFLLGWLIIFGMSTLHCCCCHVYQKETRTEAR